MNNNLVNNRGVQRLVQAGAVGLAFLLIIFAAYLFNKYDKLATNHSIEFTAAIKESTRTQQELLGAVNKWGEEIDDLNASMQIFMNYMAEFTAPFPNYP